MRNADLGMRNSGNSECEAADSPVHDEKCVHHLPVSELGLIASYHKTDGKILFIQPDFQKAQGPVVFYYCLDY